MRVDRRLGADRARWRGRQIGVSREAGPAVRPLRARRSRPGPAAACCDSRWPAAPASAPRSAHATAASADLRRRSASSGVRARRSSASARASRRRARPAARSRRGRSARPDHPVDGDHRQPAGLGLEDDLAEGVGGAGEQEHIGAGVGPGEILRRPASPGRWRARRGARAAPPPPGRRRPAQDADADRARARPGKRRPAGRRPSPWSGARRRGR